MHVLTTLIGNYFIYTAFFPQACQNSRKTADEPKQLNPQTKNEMFANEEKPV